MAQSKDKQARQGLACFGVASGTAKEGWLVHARAVDRGFCLVPGRATFSSPAISELTFAPLERAPAFPRSEGREPGDPLDPSVYATMIWPDVGYLLHPRSHTSHVARSLTHGREAPSDLARQLAKTTVDTIPSPGSQSQIPCSHSRH